MDWAATPERLRRGAVALTLVASACGGGSNDAAHAPSPPAEPTAAASVSLPTPTSSGPEAYPEDTAMRFLRADGRFETLVGIVEGGAIGAALDLWSAPHHDATIFAPTDDAFRRLDPELLAGIIDPQVVSRVVRNHVVQEPLRSPELAGRSEVQTLGVALTITTDGDRVTVEGVPIAQADREAGITIIHVLDEVLLPCHDSYLARTLGPSFDEACVAA